MVCEWNRGKEGLCLEQLGVRVTERAKLRTPEERLHCQPLHPSTNPHGSLKIPSQTDLWFRKSTCVNLYIYVGKASFLFNFQVIIYIYTQWIILPALQDVCTLLWRLLKNYLRKCLEIVKHFAKVGVVWTLGQIGQVSTSCSAAQLITLNRSFTLFEPSL